MTPMAAGFRSLFRGIGAAGAFLPLLACSGEPVAPEPDGPTLASLRAARAEGLGAALARMDEAVGTLGADPAFWLLYADTTLDLFDESLAAGRPLGHLPEDAAAGYATALELDPGLRPARIGRTRALRLAGRAEEAAAEAERAWAADPQRERWSDRELIEVGLAGLGWTVLCIQDGGGVPPAAATAAQALEYAAARGAAGAFLPLHDLYAWQQSLPAAAEAAGRGLSQGADSEALFGRLRNLGASERNLQVATLEQARRARPDDAMLLWYLGEALFFSGQEARRAHDVLKADEAFDRAAEAFVLAQAARPDFAGSCAEWLHLLRVQRAWLLREDGRIPEAAGLALEALERAPERVEAEAQPDSLRLLLDALAYDLFAAGQLDEAVDFLGRVCAAHDSDANWMNNLGFFLREQGVAAVERGDAEAPAIFERSWLAYGRAVELAPEDARIVNDRALIAVYYLDEHHDFAERELQRSIALGTRQLAEMGPDVPAQERQDLDEAVGDAWENLAYLQLIRRGRTERVEEYLDESAKHYPHARRDGVAMLRQRLAERLREP